MALTPDTEALPDGPPSSARDRRPVADRGLLLRYRTLAFVTATLLIVVVFVGIPLQVFAGNAQISNDVGTVHGVLYIVYLVFAFQLTRRLGVPKLRMALVLLAGTVPFCAFIAERTLTRRFNAQPAADPTAGTPGGASPGGRPSSNLRRRWFSRRAFVLHLEVALVAPGCVAAGWWQATRALDGNELSWIYSVEWPIFALIAIVAWWYLIHEDPEAYRLRKDRSGGEAVTSSSTAGQVDGPPDATPTVQAPTARRAKALLAVLCVETVLGILAVVYLPIGRPSGLLPSRLPALYLAHAALGIPLALGASTLVVSTRGADRLARLTAWMGASGVAVAGAGGLLTADESLRLVGMGVMFIGAVVACFGYLVPALEKLS